MLAVVQKKIGVQGYARELVDEGREAPQEQQIGSPAPEEGPTHNGI
jgi:hypothetical protein